MYNGKPSIEGVVANYILLCSGLLRLSGCKIRHNDVQIIPETEPKTKRSLASEIALESHQINESIHSET